jgi:DHA2 family multidrug resistance protein
MTATTANAARDARRAIAISTFGTIVGATMPLAVILSLGDVAGGLSVSADEASWIVTLYNVGAVVGVPTTVGFVGMFGRGRAMKIVGLGFAVASFAAGIAHSLEWMAMARFAQGFFGGSLPLLMMLLVLTSVRPGQGQLEGLTAFALVTTLAVGLSACAAAGLIALGDWRMLFLSQAVAGLVYWLAARFVFREERGNRELMRRFDWAGLILLSLGAGLLLIALSEGERRFWFEKWWIAASLAGGTVCMVLALWHLVSTPRPVMLLDVFRKPTFSITIVLQLLFRFGTLLALFITPQFLSRLQAFRVEQLASAMLVMAIAALGVTPLAYAMTRDHDPRVALSLGLALLALAAALCLPLAPDWAANEFIVPLALAGAGQTLFSTATMRYAVHGATLQDGPSRGIVFNVARTFGLVGGLALASHVVIEREKFHSAHLIESLTTFEPLTVERTRVLAGTFASTLSDGSSAQRAASAGLAQLQTKQAFALAFGDAFFIMSVVLLASAVLVWALPALPRATVSSLPAQVPSR